jgi:hypothetical protein
MLALAPVKLRALLPSWRFFDRASDSPQLFVERAAEWIAIGPAPRTWTSWAFAPRGNLALAYHAVVEQLIAEVDELDPSIPDDDPRITGLVAYALVTNIARAHVPPGARFRWRIAVGDEFLVSTELS